MRGVNAIGVNALNEIFKAHRTFPNKVYLILNQMTDFCFDTESN